MELLSARGQADCSFINTTAVQNVRKSAEVNQTRSAFNAACVIVARRLPAALADKSAVTGPWTAE